MSIAIPIAASPRRLAVVEAFQQHRGRACHGLHDQIGGHRRASGPASTPASTSASTIRKKYAGPEPDTAVTASSCDSGTVSTPPTASKIAETSLSCSAVANRPRASALTPPPTTIGALGITRMTGEPAGSLFS